MQIIAIVPRAAIPPREMGAFGPRADVVFVLKVALVAFLAQAFEPVLADQIVAGVGDGVFVGAGGT